MSVTWGGFSPGGAERRARREHVAALRAAGLSQHEIGARLGVSQAAISALLQRIDRDAGHVTVRRTHGEIGRRRDRAWQMHQSGQSHNAIAVALGITSASVSALLAGIRRRRGEPVRTSRRVQAIEAEQVRLIRHYLAQRTEGVA